MCHKCQDALNEYWPGLSQSERNALLWGATSYPFDMVAAQLKDASRRTRQNLGLALGIAEWELDFAMEEMHEREEDGLIEEHAGSAL